MPDAGSTSGVDPAASMSLLTSLLANPLDAGYVHYRATHGPRPATLLGRVGVFVVALALGFSSVVATQSLSFHWRRESRPERASELTLGAGRGPQ